MDKKHSKMEIIKTEGVCVMVFIGIIVLLAAVDLYFTFGFFFFIGCHYFP